MTTVGVRLALIACLFAAPVAADVAAPDDVLAGLRAEIAAMPTDAELRVIEAEAPEDFEVLVGQIAEVVRDDPANRAGIYDVTARYRRSVAAYAPYAPDDLVQASLRARVAMQEALDDATVACRALIWGEPLVLPEGMGPTMAPLSAAWESASLRALLRGRARAKAGETAGPGPADQDWAQVVAAWLKVPGNDRYAPILDQVLVQDPLYCAAYASFERAVAEAEPPAGPRVRISSFVNLVKP